MTRFEFKIQDKIKYQYKGNTVILKSENLNTILNLIANKIINKKANKNGYVEIHNTKFRSAFSRYEPYLSYLLYKGLIERDSYIKGEKSFGYRFTEIFKEKIEISKIYYYSDTYTKDRVQKYHPDIGTKRSIYDRLKKDFLNADVNYYPQKQQIKKTKDEWGNFIDIKKWLNNNKELFIWKKEYVYFNWSRYRIYSNFTSLSSHIRANNIQLNNEKIIEFDITSSFPLMLAQFCLNKNPGIADDYDFRNYCTTVINGKFYSELMVGLNSIRNTTKGNHESDFSTRLLKRTEVKTLFQVYINGNKNRIHYINGLRSDINKFMEQKYPSVHEIINQIKEAGKLPYDEMVRIETKIIFEIIEELYDTYDDIQILTCHDAIYVPLSFKSKTRTIWDKHLDHIKLKLPVESDIELDTSSLETLGIFCDDADDDENGCL